MLFIIYTFNLKKKYDDDDCLLKLLINLYSNLPEIGYRKRRERYHFVFNRLYFFFHLQSAIYKSFQLLFMKSKVNNLFLFPPYRSVEKQGKLCRKKCIINL